MTNAMAPFQPQSLAEIKSFGELMVKSGYFKDVRDMAQAVAKIQYGAELGIGPAASLMQIDIIQGKPAPKPALLASQIKKSGKYNYRIRKHTDEVCQIEFYEDGESVGVSEFTIKDAAKAGLTSGANSHSYQKYPRNMLFVRAISNGAKWFCPDVFNGVVYAPEELGAVVNEDGEIVEGSAEPIAEEAPPENVPQDAQEGPQNEEKVPQDSNGANVRFSERLDLIVRVAHDLFADDLAHAEEWMVVLYELKTIHVGMSDDVAYSWVKRSLEPKAALSALETAGLAKAHKHAKNLYAAMARERIVWPDMDASVVVQVAQEREAAKADAPEA